MNISSVSMTIGDEAHALARKLWPINRSLTGDGVRETLSIIKTFLPGLQQVEVPSGTAAFDWTVPKEWRVRDAWIVTPAGEKICRFKENNLHLVGYSIPVHKKIGLEELREHLYSLPEQPTATPYITSYYQERWGFCIPDSEKQKLQEGVYEVFIDSDHFDGHLTYGEVLIKGKSDREIFLSTYICHPSMANNEISGPVVTTLLGRWLSGQNDLNYSYRIVFIPETIGSIVYLSKNLETLKKRMIAGFNVTCVGDDRDYSYLPSRQGDTLSDQVAKHVLKHIHPTYKAFKWADRGSDERQYCAPHIDLPVASLMRTKYGVYPEYHTSLDDLENVVTPRGLEGGFNALKRAIESVENNCLPTVTVLGEPQLGRRGLYPTLSTKNSAAEVRLMMNLLTWSDGKKSILEIAEICEVPIWTLYPLVEKLREHQLLTVEPIKHGC